MLNTPSFYRTTNCNQRYYLLQDDTTIWQYSVCLIFFNHKWTCNELYSTDITVTNIDEHSPSSFKTYWNIDSLKILKQTAAQYKIISVCDEINMTNMLLFRKIIASNQFKTISTGFHSVVRLEDALKTLKIWNVRD